MWANFRSDYWPDSGADWGSAGLSGIYSAPLLPQPLASMMINIAPPRMVNLKHCCMFYRLTENGEV